MQKILLSIYKIAIFIPFLCVVDIQSAPQFSDDFESGDLSHIENGYFYMDSTSASVSSEFKKDGNFSLRFFYGGESSGGDGFSEQRIGYPQTGELWIKYELYIPSNYYHRSESGASNNKFLAIFRNEYRFPGFQINWSLTPNGNGGSSLSLHRYRYGEEQGVISPTGGLGNNIITQADRGKWISIRARVKVPSNGSATDGIMQMWKNGVLVCDERSLNNYGGDGENYTDELYLLGWSNSGFSEDTTFYIDNLYINNQSFAKPKPPLDNIVN